jgi:hypothetical protein
VRVSSEGVKEGSSDIVMKPCDGLSFFSRPRPKTVVYNCACLELGAQQTEVRSWKDPRTSKK